MVTVHYEMCIFVSIIEFLSQFTYIDCSIIRMADDFF